MYSVLVSKFDVVFNIIEKELKKIVRENMKVAIIPWAFPVEINAKIFENDYFPVEGRRYLKYVDLLMKLGIKKENVIVCNCYKHNKEELKSIIRNSNILLLPGGNPEMFFQKVVHDTEILYDIKYFDGIIIGESAGCELQLKRYFITAKNNYYKYFAFYDGFAVLDNPFYIDVHSINNKRYLDKLQSIANDKKEKVYAIFDDGAIIYNRHNNHYDLYGNVLEFSDNNS